MASQALLTFFATLNRSSLGVISNNPGNLVSNKWTQSLPGYRSMNKEGFAVFATPGDGIDALQLNLHSYEVQGVNTPFKIASMWAPAGQAGNDPIAYAETKLSVPIRASKSSRVLMTVAIFLLQIVK